ncbi:MAG: Peptide chain release factor 2 [Chlamydiia bacterium]|nr:Peptide chain release factor 2 [Chlamydiia bacterium]MCH9618116.1 Peptide chain release factor 2 [Chlamydiia bacterium]MCH9623996.1 Peptide chain release factor 2 [Chlamydiia bacterium]
MISKDKKEKLDKDLRKAGIFEEDIEEKFILGTGSGGQKVNKTCSTVFIKHLPTGLTVRCGKDRLQSSNRFFARRRLLEKLLEQKEEKKSKRMQEAAKIRKQKKRRSKKTKEKILNDKKHRGKIKEERGKTTD